VTIQSTDAAMTHNAPSAGRRIPPWAVLVVCSVAQFMVVLDVTIVNVALPQMRTALDLSANGQQWVINAYTLTFAGFLMLGGRAADLFGRRRIFMIGLVIFTAFSLAGGLSNSGSWLIAARAAQGLGGAILAPATLSILTSTFTEAHERRKALGVWSATAASGAAAGVVAGGVLTDLLDWRWVLFVNVPIGVALLVGAFVALKESKAPAARQSLDLPGAATVTAGTAVLVYAIVGTSTHPWGSARTLESLALAVVLLASFVVIEAKFASAPLIPLGVFRRRALSAANAVAFTVGATLFGTYFFVSLYLQQVQLYSPLKTGLAFLPVGLATLGGALIASRIVHHLGIRRQLIIAPLFTIAGLFWLHNVVPGSGYLSAVFGPLALIGIGVGLTFVPMTLAATTGVPHHQAGLASGLINTSRQLGGAIGLAVLATIAASTAQHHGSGAHAIAAALTKGYDRAFLVMAIVAIVGAITACLIPRPQAAGQQAA
jgi:EmrB/QacA subfamily drug resistance transporter